jgi:hypothetical protein
MPTLILSPRQTADIQALATAAQERGWSVVQLPNWRAPTGIKQDDVVLYGEPLFAEIIASELGIALLQAPLDWLTTLPQQFLQRTVTYHTLGAARRLPGPIFVKPADAKSFVAQVYSHGQALPNDDIFEDYLPVLVSDPVQWLVEYRCVVIDRHVVTASPYLRAGQLAQADDESWPASTEEQAAALNFATSVLSTPSIEVPPAFVLDIGFIAERGWAVIEANSVWGAGIYGCSPEVVLTALQRGCISVTSLSAADRRWARELPEVEYDQSPNLPTPDAEGCITLYRPVGDRELALIAATNYQHFPPRLPEQPIFYPVLNERYATEIASNWNTHDAASDDIGHVTRFRVSAQALANYPVQVAGASYHQELWIPAEDLNQINAAIVGLIEVITTFRGDAV